MNNVTVLCRRAEVKLFTQAGFSLSPRKGPGGMVRLEHGSADAVFELLLSCAARAVPFQARVTKTRAYTGALIVSSGKQAHIILDVQREAALKGETALVYRRLKASLFRLAAGEASR